MLFSLTSCGTLTKKEEFFQIDSTPRGLEVLNEDGESLGMTPLISLSNQKSSSDYFIQGDETKFSHSCGLDWQHSMIPSLLIMPIAIPITPIFSTVFLGIDYLSDNLFSCTDLLYLTPKKELKIVEKEQTTIILPVFDGHKFNIQDLIQNATNKFESEYKLLSYGESLQYFSKYGITEENFWSLQNIKKQSLLKVIRDTDATSIMTLNRKVGGEFEVQIIDLYTYKAKTKKVSIKTKLTNEDNTFKAFAKRYIYFIPNSLSVGGLKTDGYFEDDDEGSFSSSMKNPNNLHWLVSMWSFSSVSSPYLFNPWDFDFRLSPQISLPSFRAEFPNNYSINLNTYNASYDLSVTGHTPLGSLSMSLGAGVGYFEGEDSVGKSIGDTTPLFHLNLSYVAFLNERFFFKFSLDQNHYFGDSEKINGYGLDRTSTLSYNIGYYFPELQSFFR